jgi:hypothetical protein
MSCNENPNGLNILPSELVVCDENPNGLNILPSKLVM